MLYIDASGKTHRPGAVVCGVQTHAGMSQQAWADLGCVPYTPPTVELIEPEQEPNVPFRLTKLHLETFLSAHGMETAFLQALQSDPAAYHKYLISGDIASDHPLVNAFLPVIAGKMGLTAEEAMDMLREAAI